MGLVDHSQSFEVPYTLENTFCALQAAINNLDGMKLDKVEESIHTLYVKSGISVFSWGENITISLAENINGYTKITVLSTPKTGVMFGGALDMGKNRRNIERISKELSDILAYFPKIKPNINNSSDINDLYKLAELLERGLISEDEYQLKKKQILGL